MPAVPHRWWRAGVPLLVAALLTSAKAPAQQDPRDDRTGPVRSDEETRSLLDGKRLRLRFESAPLAEWTSSISKALEIPVTFPPRAQELDASRTTLADFSLPEMPASRALDAVAVVTGLRWRVFRGIVLFDVHVPSVRILGEVVRAGPAALEEGDTVLALLARAEWTETADLEHVLLVRAGAGKPRMRTIDVRARVMSDRPAGVAAQDGDLLIVPPIHGPPGEPTAEQPLEAAPLPAAQREREWVEPGQKVVFFIGPRTLRDPEIEQLTWLTRTQTVDYQGRILVPYVGRIVVRGLTRTQIEQQVKQQLFAALSKTFPIRARVFRR